MIKRLSSHILIALREALAAIYWLKDDLREFLEKCKIAPDILDAINWNNHNKQQIADYIINRLDDNIILYFDDLLFLCHEICNLTSFRHLKWIDNSRFLIKRARTSVSHLRKLFKQYQKDIHNQKLINNNYTPTFNKIELNHLRNSFVRLISSEKYFHKRGYELEKLFIRLLNLYGLNPKSSFKSKGEQIDGAFYLDGTNFILETKWAKKPVTASDLNNFSIKVTSKLENTLGLFLSINGFSNDGVYVYCKGKRPSIILMDKLDLMAVLDEHICLIDLIRKKKDYAAQTGNIYISAKQCV
jgi:hypothetical protein